MRRHHYFLLTIAVWLASRATVWANNPPGPFTMLPEAAILPLMVLLSLAGGFYQIRGRQEAARWGKAAKAAVVLVFVLLLVLSLSDASFLFVMALLGGGLATARAVQTTWKVAGVIVLIVLSCAHEMFGGLLAMVFAGMAAVRAIRMLMWGLQAGGLGQTDEIAAVGPRRLLTAGACLLAVALFLGVMPFACLGWWTAQVQEGHDGEALRAYVEYQLGYAQWKKETTGRVVFDPRRLGEISRGDAGMRYLFDIWHESGEPNVPTEDRPRAIIQFGPDGKTFTAWLPPLAKFRPWFPYNYLDWVPSWRADESGQIRMKRVPNTERCPSDAPVIMVADQHAVQQWAASLKTNGPPRAK